MKKYSNAPARPEDVLKLIARAVSGREVLSGFVGLLRSGRVRFEPYPGEVLARLREALGEGQPVGACFVNDGTQGSIHYDPAAPLGVLAPFFVHEMVHAQDASLWIAATGLKASRRERDRLMLEAEARAFELQYRFVEELRALDGEYDSFLREQQARVRILHERLLERDISELYNF